MPEFTNGQLTKIVKGFQNMIDAQAKEVEAQRIRIELLENTTRALRAELLNTKQLYAHLHGRGMGSTVHNEGE
jgi:hypothetical protein